MFILLIVLYIFSDVLYVYVICLYNIQQFLREEGKLLQLLLWICLFLRSVLSVLHPCISKLCYWVYIHSGIVHLLNELTFLSLCNVPLYTLQLFLTLSDNMATPVFSQLIITWLSFSILFLLACTRLHIYSVSLINIV